MRFSFITVLAVVGTNAFPSVMHHLMQRDQAQPGCTVSALCDTPLDISDAEANIGSNDFTRASAARTNCGALGECTDFDAAEQYVSTTGANAYQSPGVDDIRGPCPGLNVAANHGYLPRNGIATIQQTIDGMAALWNMSPDLAGFLAAYSVAFAGDAITGTWSIGGPLPADILSGLVGVPQGDGYTHNNYESDSSLSRCDAYMNGGDAHSASMVRFSYAYAYGLDDDRYTLDKLAQHYAKNTHRSIQQNPLYFAGLFSTTLVAPAAHNFVINFMSNHSAEEPAGYLDGATFKSFWGVTGDYPNFTWLPGQERITENWYKRPAQNPYSVASVFADLVPGYLAYPDTFRLGGNSDGVDTYTGVDITNLTSGVYGGEALYEGDNFACFFFRAEQMVVPQILKGLLNDVATALDLLDRYVFGGYLEGLTCPELEQFDNDALTRYTGAGYQPAAPVSGPMNC